MIVFLVIFPISGSGLPAGMHEVTLIERARMKRAWEKAMPPITGPESLEKRRKLIEAIERDAWAFRDQVLVLPRPPARFSRI